MIGRQVTNAPSPHTDTLKGTNMKVKKLLSRYTEHNYRCELDKLDTAWHFCICPTEIGCGLSYTKLFFEINEEVYGYTTTDTWTLNANTTGINLTTLTGGRVDNMALASTDNQMYLTWAFMDSNFNFAGFGLTKKPYSTFTTAGAVNKGASGTFTVTSGYQFTIGARICVRNQNGSAPMYEWNWGTITAVANTTITATMDNNSTYGTNITATAANGEILQWNKFRPYIVTTTSQTLYMPYFILIGESLVRSSDFGHVYTRHEDTRDFTQGNLLYTNTANLLAQPLDLARYIPMWADRSGFRIQATDNAVGSAVRIYSLGGAFCQLDTQLSNVGITATGDGPLLNYAKALVDVTAAFTTLAIRGLSYVVHGGMHS